jgi:hypothetical protein
MAKFDNKLKPITDPNATKGVMDQITKMYDLGQQLTVGKAQPAPAKDPAPAEAPKQETNLAGAKAAPKDVQDQTNVVKDVEATYGYELPEGKTWARRCEKCGKGMIEGFVIDGGAQYYCSEECLHKDVSPEEWEQLYEEGGDSYWTTWEDKSEWYEE